MTKAFNELITKQHVLCELAAPLPPGVSAAKPAWLKDVEVVIGKCYPGTVDLINSDLYYRSVGKIAQRNVHLTFYPVQDLIRELYAVKVVNKYELAAKILPWEDFLKNVQDNIDDPVVQSVITQWKTQLQDGDYEGYIIKNAALAKEYANKRKDKEAVSVAALSVYNNDKIYEALVKIIERRLTGLQRVEGEIARRLGSVTKYEAVLRTVLNNPAQVAASVKKLPADFFKYCEITDRELIRLSLACESFYSTEVARVVSLAIERKVREEASTPTDTTPAGTAPAGATSARYNVRDSKGRFAKKLDLSSVQKFKDILSIPSFERFAKNKHILTEADLWQDLSTYFERYGRKATQSIWSAVRRVTAAAPIVTPITITDYERFLRTGVIKTTVKVPEKDLIPGGSSDEIELQIDSSKEMINNKPIVYNVGFINALADAPNAKEAQELRDSLRNLAEYIGKDNKFNLGQSVKALAGVLK